MNLNGINWLAVILATLSVFVIGGFWYSVLFSKAWMKANGFTKESLAKANPLVIFGLSLVCAFVMALNLALFLNSPQTTLAWGIGAAFLAGFGWVVMALWIIGLFERKSLRLMLIHGGYAIVAFVAMGAIIGGWR